MTRHGCIGIRVCDTREVKVGIDRLIDTNGVRDVVNGDLEAKFRSAGTNPIFTPPRLVAGVCRMVMLTRHAKGHDEDCILSLLGANDRRTIELSRPPAID